GGLPRRRGLGPARLTSQRALLAPPALPPPPGWPPPAGLTGASWKSLLAALDLRRLAAGAAAAGYVAQQQAGQRRHGQGQKPSHWCSPWAGMGRKPLGSVAERLGWLGRFGRFGRGSEAFQRS